MNLNFTLSGPEQAGGDRFSPFASGARPPVICPRNLHNISRRDIDPDALKVLYRLARNRYTAYLVGGGVRDLLLGRRPKDFDVSTDARPEQIRASFKNCILIGRRFRLAHIRYGGKIIETSTFRRMPERIADPDNPEADLFQRDDNSFGSPEEDARRRDFTINGLFYDIETLSVIDYVGGLDDIAGRKIRSIGDPNIRFREDPVRMVRAVRFASRLGFDLEDETLKAIRRHRGEIAKAATARLLEEVTRLFAFSSGEKAMRLLRDTGLLEAALPEINAYLNKAGDDEQLFWRRLEEMDRGDSVMPEPTPGLIFSALTINPARFFLERRDVAERGPLAGFDAVRTCLAPLAGRLKFPRKLTDRVIRLILAQSRFDNPQQKTHLHAVFASHDWFREALALRELDVAARGEPLDQLSYWRRLLAEAMDGGEAERRRGRRPDKERESPSVQAAVDLPAGADPAADREGLPQPRELSRSARRRRQRRRNHRVRDNAGVEPVAPSDAGAAVEAVLMEPAESGPGPAEPPAAEKRGAVENGQARERGRRRRRGRAARQADAGSSLAAEPEAIPGDAAATADDASPLSAEKFYKAPTTTANHPARSGEIKKVPAAKSKGTLPRGDPVSGQESDHVPHWLDEI